MHRNEYRNTVFVAVALWMLVGGSMVAAQSETPAFYGTVQFRAVGVRNDANVATVVVCNNVGTMSDVGVDFRSSSGVSVCNENHADAYSGATVTFATQPVELFPDADVCGDPGPTIQIGTVLIGGVGTVRCTALLVPPNTTTPEFAVNLEIYPVN